MKGMQSFRISHTWTLLSWIKALFFCLLLLFISLEKSWSYKKDQRPYCGDSLSSFSEDSSLIPSLDSNDLNSKQDGQNPYPLSEMTQNDFDSFLHELAQVEEIEESHHEVLSQVDQLILEIGDYFDELQQLDSLFQVSYPNFHQNYEVFLKRVRSFLKKRVGKHFKNYFEDIEHQAIFYFVKDYMKIYEKFADFKDVIPDAIITRVAQLRSIDAIRAHFKGFKEASQVAKELKVVVRKFESQFERPPTPDDLEVTAPDLIGSSQYTNSIDFWGFYWTVDTPASLPKEETFDIYLSSQPRLFTTGSRSEAEDIFLEEEFKEELLSNIKGVGPHKDVSIETIQDVFVMYFIKGMNLKEIHQELQVTNKEVNFGYEKLFEVYDQTLKKLRKRFFQDFLPHFVKDSEIKKRLKKVYQNEDPKFALIRSKIESVLLDLDDGDVNGIHKKMITLRYEEGLPWSEIVEQTGVGRSSLIELNSKIISLLRDQIPELKEVK